ncbi:MAG: hypothetical protein ACJATT_004415 [Myxococcota bacterium]
MTLCSPHPHWVHHGRMGGDGAFSGKIQAVMAWIVPARAVDNDALVGDKRLLFISTRNAARPHLLQPSDNSFDFGIQTRRAPA